MSPGAPGAPPDDADPAHNQPAAEVPPASAYSLFRFQRLVAYVYRRPGALRRAGQPDPLCECAFADVEIFEPRELDVFLRLAETAGSFDAYVFALGMEGLDVQAGLKQPHGALRRF